MMPMRLRKADWEDLIASEFQQLGANLHVIDETFRQRVNQQLQEASQQNREHLARASEILARSLQDDFPRLYQPWQGRFDEAIASLRNDARVAMAGIREKFSLGTFLGDYFCIVGKSATATEHDAALKRLTIRLRQWPIDPRAKRALRHLAYKRWMSMGEVLTELLPFVIPMVLRRRAKEQQTIREGQTWVKVDGRIARVVPTKHYNLGAEEAFVSYLKKEVRNAIEESLIASNDEEPQTDQSDITVRSKRVVFDENATHSSGDIDFALPINLAAVDEHGPESRGQVGNRLCR